MLFYRPRRGDSNKRRVARRLKKYPSRIIATPVSSQRYVADDWNSRLSASRIPLLNPGVMLLSELSDCPNNAFKITLKFGGSSVAVVSWSVP